MTCVALLPARTHPRRRCRHCLLLLLAGRAAGGQVVSWRPVPCRLPPVCVVVAASYQLRRSQSTGVQATVYTLLEEMPPSQKVWSACLAMLFDCGNIGSPGTLSTYIHALDYLVKGYWNFKLGIEEAEMSAAERRQGRVDKQVRADLSRLVRGGFAPHATGQTRASRGVGRYANRVACVADGRQPSHRLVQPVSLPLDDFG